jgi:hypothetical protein
MVEERTWEMIKSTDPEMKKLGMITLLGGVETKGEWKRAKRKLVGLLDRSELRQIKYDYATLRIGKRNRDRKNGKENPSEVS